MKDQLAVSMRSTTSTAREFMHDLAASGFSCIQIDAQHADFQDLTVSGHRDVAATLRRSGLRAGGVDFLASPQRWESNADQTLSGLKRAVALATSIEHVPVSVCVPPDEDIIEAVITVGIEAGVLPIAHRSTPFDNPNIGWGLPVALLAKEEQPMKTLAGAAFGPIALRLSGNILGSTTLGIDEDTVELSELRGVLDAMGWSPIPVIDASGDEAADISCAWQSAGPW